MDEYKVIHGVECCIKYTDKVLMLRRNLNKAHYPGYLCFPGGKMNCLEDSISATIREVKEETGIVLDQNKMKLVVNEFNYHVDDKELWIISTFSIEYNEAQSTCESAEGTIEWICIDNIDQNKEIVPQTLHYIKHAISPSDKIFYMVTTYEKDKITKIISERYI